MTMTTMTTMNMTMTMTMGRGRGRSQSQSRNLSGAGNFKNGWLRQPWIKVVIAMDGLRRYRTYEIRKKVQNLNKRYENWIKGTKIELKVQKSKSRYKISIRICGTTKRNVFLVSRNNSKHLISYFAKRSKLGETLTCFVKFRISQNYKKKKLLTLGADKLNSDHAGVAC